MTGSVASSNFHFLYNFMLWFFLHFSRKIKIFGISMEGGEYLAVKDIKVLELEGLAPSCLGKTLEEKIYC